MGDLLYAEEKFRMAVYLMATGKGSLKDRLAQAFYEIHSVSLADLPDHLKEDFIWIIESLTKKPAKRRALIQGAVIEGYEGRIGATLAYMRLKRAEEIARRIYALSDEISRANQ